MTISFCQLAMREACKYVEEKLATKVSVLKSLLIIFICIIVFGITILGNDSFNVSLKFTAQNLDKLMEALMISLG